MNDGAAVREQITLSPLKIVLLFFSLSLSLSVSLYLSHSLFFPIVSIAWPVILQLIIDIARIRFFFLHHKMKNNAGSEVFQKQGCETSRSLDWSL